MALERWRKEEIRRNQGSSAVAWESLREMIVELKVSSPASTRKGQEI